MEDGNVTLKTNNALLFETMFDVEKNSEEPRAEHEVLISLYRELEKERNAAATAANEAMSMISRLQNEKAVLQMEARHYKQRTEERAFYDEKVITLLKELILKQEADNLTLENEVKLYKQRLLKYSISNMKEESALPNSEEIDGVFHELLATSDEEKTLTTKSITDSAEELFNIYPDLKKDGEGQGELFGLWKTFHQTQRPPDACEPWLNGHHTGDGAGPERMLSVLNVDDHGLDVKVKDVIVQNPMNSKAQDVVVDEFELAPLKWVNMKISALLEEADNLDEVVEEHWQAVLDQLWKLKEQIGNFREIHLPDSKEHSCLFKGQQCKNSVCNDQCHSRKQQKESPREYVRSRYRKNVKTLRSVKRWTAAMGKGLHEVKSRSKFPVECSRTVWENKGSNCSLVENVNFCKARNDTKYRPMHPLNITGEFDYGLLKSLAGMESPPIFGAKIMMDHHKPVTGGERVLFASKDKTEQTCEQALETARNAMTEVIGTKKQNLGRTDMVHEVTQKSYASEDCYFLVEKVYCQPRGPNFAADLLKGFLLSTKLGNLLSNFSRCLQFQVGLMEDLFPLDTFYSSETETDATSCEQDATLFSDKSDTQIKKHASLSSTDLTWLKDRRGRSGTAFAGWDL